MPSLTNAPQHAGRDLGTAGCERQAGQRNHRVAAPVAEPRIASDDGVPRLVGALRAAPHYELVGREHELLRPVGAIVRRGEQLLLPAALGCVRERAADRRHALGREP
jgi:hypothetical protein